MNNEDVVGGILWLLGVATLFLLATAVALAMARDGLVLWDQAKEAVRALSTFSTLLVGVVVVVHLKGTRAKK
ncbi:MAG TPA: hypothetical protein VEK15_17890 [Vicinamibacteria bacterium]|nr:hypothetical protein [Vicinamibacteria bacterium]